MNRNEIERERRSNMRDLFSRLFSLLPPHSSRRLSIPDRLDQATLHINQLRTNLEGLERRRLQLRGANRLISSTPVVNISEYSNNSGMEVNLISGSDQLNLLWSEIIIIIQQEGGEVVSFTYSNAGNMNILSIHCQAALSYINGIDRSRLLHRLRTVVEEY